MTPEGKIEAYLIRQCTKKAVLCYKFTSPANNGVPDRLIIANNKTWFVELKAPGEEPRALQIKVMKKMTKAGATVYVADSKRQIDDILNNILS